MNKRVRKKKRMMRLLITAAIDVMEFDMEANNLLVVTVDTNEVALDEFNEFFRTFQKDVLSFFPDVKIIATIDGIRVRQQNEPIAEWVNEEENVWRCSNCGAVLEEDYNWHNHQFCYHCGCSMKY